mmetsp:Transcript_3771/g.11741  ORF Transcript_3771/g.11741 Transcript_3771/m.11741 type:complete len:286 (-) Transcript_3771:337-1194(-)
MLADVALQRRPPRLGELSAVPLADPRLALVLVPTPAVAGVTHIRRVETVHEAKGPVVDREPEDRHVVRVQDAVAPAHALPRRHQPPRALAHLAQHRGVHRRLVARAAVLGNHIREEGLGDIVQHDGQQLRLEAHTGPLHACHRVALAEDLKRAKAQKCGRHARDHAGALHRDVTVVFLVARHTRVAGRQAGGARGGYAQRVHVLRAQELADGGAQHLAPIAAARVQRWACALELQLPPLAARVEALAEVHRRAVAQLPAKMAELVAAVAVRGGRSPRQQPRARKQ